MPEAICPSCGIPFVASAARRVYCQQACYVAFTRQRAAEGLIDRFWAKVKKTPTCWYWTASTNRGYGQFHLARTDEGGQQTVYAHRFSWSITVGSIPDTLSVLHRCDQPLCVNPDHLFLGTRSDNLADARQKGRLIDGRHLIKVSDAGLADIQRRYVPRQNGKQLAAEYDISLVHVLRIVNGTARVKRAPVFERVPHVELPFRGELHLDECATGTAEPSMQFGSTEGC